MLFRSIKSAVPPCVAVADTPTHYEAAAETDGKQHVFGYVVAHRDVITVGFNTEISDKDMHELVSERLRKMMNEHRRLEIREAHVSDLRQDIQEAFNAMLNYFNEKNWVKP